MCIVRISGHQLSFPHTLRKEMTKTDKFVLQSVCLLISVRQRSDTADQTVKGYCDWHLRSRSALQTRPRGRSSGRTSMNTLPALKPSSGYRVVRTWLCDKCVDERPPKQSPSSWGAPHPHACQIRANSCVCAAAGEHLKFLIFSVLLPAIFFFN